MINHIRTLLLNLPADATFATPGEEFIPSSFSPVTLSPTLAMAHSILFGTAPDRLGVNIRVRQILTVIETSPLASYLTELDPRITYDLSTPLEVTPGVTVLGALPLNVHGRLDDVDSTGRCRWQYTIRLNETTATLIRETPPRLETDIVVTYTNGLSASTSLPGSSALVSWPVATSAEWQIQVTRPYTQSLGSVLAAARQASPAMLADVFGGSLHETSEPWKTFLGVWYDDREGLSSLGAFALSLAYRIHREFYA